MMRRKHDSIPAKSDHPRFAVFAPVYPPARLGGGPIRTLKALIDQQPADIESLVFTQDTDLGQHTKLDVTSNELLYSDGRYTYYVSCREIAKLMRGLAAVKQFRPNFLYVNGFFTPIFSLIPQVLWRLGYFGDATLVLAPRGEFSQGALALKSAKKSLFLSVYRLLRLHRSIVWHASAQAEADDIARVFGTAASVLIRENETELPQIAMPPSPPSNGALRVVFVSRIVKKKGLHLLLESLKLVASKIDLRVYGTVEDPAYFAHCEVLASDLPANVNYAYCGPLEPDEVRGTFNRHDIFIFPTAGENFGHVIAESLSASCPVMCSDRTPWSEVLQAGAGVVVQNSRPNSWAAAIESYALLSPAIWRERRLEAAERYRIWRSSSKGDHVFVQAVRLRRQ